ncbi:MAG: YIP1 family protein [Thermodesulfobacteriota bacterium]
MTSCPSPPQWKRPFPDRLVAALRLDRTVFAEVARDADAMGQAAGVVALSSLAQGIGGIQATSTTELVGGIVAMVVVGFLGWLASTGVIWLIGVGLLSGRSDYPELLRTLGFASAPKLLWLAGVLPLGPLYAVLGLVIFVLTLLALVLAVRQALEVTTGRAVLVCVLGVLTGFALAFAVGTLIGLGAGLAR